MVKHDFTGKRAIVTGGGSGIGKAIAAMLSATGARVAIAGRRRDRLEAAAAEIGNRCMVIPADLREPDQAQAMVAEAIAALGGLDILINNAGRGWHAPLRTMNADVWQGDFALNSHAAFYCSQAAFDALKSSGNGAIVSISSLAGQHGTMGVGAYSAAKAALQMFTRVAAAEWGPQNIRVNAVAAGMIATDGAIGNWAKTGFDAMKASAGFPLRRPGRPDEVAQAVLFLASDAASYITGEVLAVAGGPQIKGMIET